MTLLSGSSPLTSRFLFFPKEVVDVELVTPIGAPIVGSRGCLFEESVCIASTSAAGVIAAVACAGVRLRFFSNLSMLKILLYLTAATLIVMSDTVCLGMMTAGFASFNALMIMSKVAVNTSAAALLSL